VLASDAERLLRRCQRVRRGGGHRGARTTPRCRPSTPRSESPLRHPKARPNGRPPTSSPPAPWYRRSRDGRWQRDGQRALYQSLVNRYGHAQGLEDLERPALSKRSQRAGQHQEAVQLRARTVECRSQLAGDAARASLDAYHLGHEDCQASTAASQASQTSAQRPGVEPGAAAGRPQTGYAPRQQRAGRRRRTQCKRAPDRRVRPRPATSFRSSCTRSISTAPGFKRGACPSPVRRSSSSWVRGVDYAWSATSAGADIVDQRLEKLCNTDGSPPTTGSTAYMYNGVCTPMFRCSWPRRAGSRCV